MAFDAEPQGSIESGIGFSNEANDDGRDWRLVHVPTWRAGKAFDIKVDGAHRFANLHAIDDLFCKGHTELTVTHGGAVPRAKRHAEHYQVSRHCYAQARLAGDAANNFNRRLGRKGLVIEDALETACSTIALPVWAIAGPHRLSTKARGVVVRVLLLMKPLTLKKAFADIGVTSRTTREEFQAEILDSGLIEWRRGTRGVIMLGRPRCTDAAFAELDLELATRQSAPQQAARARKVKPAKRTQKAAQREPRHQAETAPPAQTRDTKPRRRQRNVYVDGANGRLEFPNTWRFTFMRFLPIPGTTLNTILANARKIWTDTEPKDVEAALAELSSEMCGYNASKQENPAIGDIMRHGAPRAAELAAYEVHGTPEQHAGGEAAGIGEGKDALWFSSSFCHLAQHFVDELTARYPRWLPSDPLDWSAHWELRRAFTGITSELGSTGYGTTLQGEVQRRFTEHAAEIHAKREAELHAAEKARAERDEKARAELSREHERELAELERRKAERAARERQNAKESMRKGLEGEVAWFDTDDAREMLRNIEAAHAREGCGGLSAKEQAGLAMLLETPDGADLVARVEALRAEHGFAPKYVLAEPSAQAV